MFILLMIISDPTVILYLLKTKGITSFIRDRCRDRFFSLKKTFLCRR